MFNIGFLVVFVGDPLVSQHRRGKPMVSCSGNGGFSTYIMLACWRINWEYHGDIVWYTVSLFFPAVSVWKWGLSSQFRFFLNTVCTENDDSAVDLEVIPALKTAHMGHEQRINLIESTKAFRHSIYPLVNKHRPWKLPIFNGNQSSNPYLAGSMLIYWRVFWGNHFLFGLNYVKLRILCVNSWYSCLFSLS